MTDAQRRERNRARLQECEPAFRHALALVIAEMQGEGYRPRIQDAWRSPKAQEVAYAGGYSDVKIGFHCVCAADGSPAAMAADVLDDDHPLNPARDYVIALARHARAHGLETGILWRMPPTARRALDAMIRDGGYWNGKIGYDPCHAQVTGITIAEAIESQQGASHA